MEFELVQLSNSRNASLFDEIEEYKFRASDLCDFARNTSWGVFEFFVDRSDPNRPIISGTLPNESLVTTFYSKYRHAAGTKLAGASSVGNVKYSPVLGVSLPPY